MKEAFENIVGKGENAGNLHPVVFSTLPKRGPAWLSGKVFWVRATLDPLSFFVGVSFGKTFQGPSLVLAKPRKGMNNVSCYCDMTEILLKVT